MIEATQFKKQQADTFPLSEPAKAFIKQSIRQRRWSRIKTASWLIIPMFIGIGVGEHYFREFNVDADYGRMHSAEGTYEERKAVEDLVHGCAARRKMRWLPPYLTERLFGYCRPLLDAPLNGANLRGAFLSRADLSRADLSTADLSTADLRYADLSGADLSHAFLSHAFLSHAFLSYADLSYADLSGARLLGANLSVAYLSFADLSRADLSDADLSDADLSDADLSYAIILSADLRTTQGLIQAQIEGDTPPLICNSPLPEGIEIDSNRDCETLANVLFKGYTRHHFGSFEEAQKFVDLLRQKKWD